MGFELGSPAYVLRSFARHVTAVRHRGPLTVEIMSKWAQRDNHGGNDPRTWARRLKRLRSFTRWLQQFEPRTEVPDDAIFGRLPERLAPHIYSEQEIVDLLAAARRLGPAPGLRGVIFETLFGLIACSGLRVSEALALRNVDVDLKHGMFTVHQTKFAKSRQVPMHLSTVEALRSYRCRRDLSGESAQEDAPFFVGTRGRRRGLPLGQRQVDRVFAKLRQQLGWCNRGAHHAPRIHDLRHTFVVRRILLWQAQGVDIDQAMLSLSTYVGHAKVTNTYWYLSAVPELMALAAGRFESFLRQPEASDA
ncbi:MAG: tyrosine-type recombinase/integrase [Betaproteobacteria bacterium]|nr:tyrosine-type recombinase/integrase [Betaproteobacteria bacterium]